MSREAQRFGLALALALLTAVALTEGEQALGSDGPRPVERAASPTASATLLPPSPTITFTPTPTETPIQTLTQTPTVSAGVEYSAGIYSERIVRWTEAVELFLPDFAIPQDTVLILSMMAAESHGEPYVISPAGACGLMQVIWKPWYAISKTALCDSPFANIREGLRIFGYAVQRAELRGEDLTYALAYYNCSEEKVLEDGCGSRGGLNYANEVLHFWYPRIAEAMEGD